MRTLLLHRLYDQTEKSCYFVDAWCLREDFSELFAQQVSLFPPDVAKACGLTMKHNTSLNATLSTSGQLDRYIWHALHRWEILPLGCIVGCYLI